MIVYAVISITLALILYSVGVWSERLQGRLKTWHLCVFWLGLVFDTIGTTLMSKIVSNGFKLNFHGITGLLAIMLMLFHAAWATIVIVKRDEKAKANFHRLSILVWFVWLIPYLSGMVFGIAR
jgi:uncharacterized repeat protein (TIGR03987 family)